MHPWNKSEHTLFNLSVPMLAVRPVYPRQNRYMNTFNLIRQISILFAQILLQENITVKFGSDQNCFCFLSLYLSVSDCKISGFGLWKKLLTHYPVRKRVNCYVCWASFLLTFLANFFSFLTITFSQSSVL